MFWVYNTGSRPKFCYLYTLNMSIFNACFALSFIMKIVKQTHKALGIYFWPFLVHIFSCSFCKTATCQDYWSYLLLLVCPIPGGLWLLLAVQNSVQMSLPLRSLPGLLKEPLSAHFFLVSLFCCLLISTYVQNYLVKLVGVLCIASYVESKFHGSGTLGVFFTAVPRVWHTQFSTMLSEPGHCINCTKVCSYLCTWERVMIGLLPYPCVLQTFIGHS